MSAACVERLATQGWLGRTEWWPWTRLHDDHLLPMLVYAVGLRPGDFASGHAPLGVAWEGLPCSPEALLRAGKAIVHSTRFYEDLDEQAIRSWFRGHRA
jgi:hypothetical protein